MREIFRKSIPALCEDGNVRSASVRCYCYDGSYAADTWFSVPASIRIAGKYVAGYVTGAEEPDGGWKEYDTRLIFRAMDSHKHLMPR